MLRVVVTGLGVVSPLGSGADIAWARLLAGQSGLRGLPDWAAPLPAKIAGIVPDRDEDPDGGFDPHLAAPVKDQRKMDHFIQSRSSRQQRPSLRPDGHRRTLERANAPPPLSHRVSAASRPSWTRSVRPISAACAACRRS